MILALLTAVIAVTNIVARMERSEIRDARDAGPGLRFARSGLQPRDLPVGLFLDRRVESFFGFSEKYFCSHLPQIRSRTLASHPTRGACHDRHGRGVECGGRGSVLRAKGLQGGLAKGP